MNKEFKKTFFVCLLSVLLVVSNIVGAKLTNFLDVTVGVEFVTYPFTFLCTLLILNLGGKRDAYRGILVASVIQLLICISYVLITSLGTQSLMPDQAAYVNGLFKVNESKILTSVFAFIISHCTLIYIYDNFKHLGKELYGLVIGLLGSMILNSVVYLVITLSDYDAIFVINMLLSNIIISIIMVVVITIMFYLLRDKEVPTIAIKKTKNNLDNDLNMEEIVKEKKKVSNTNVKRNNKNKTNYSSTSSKKNTTKNNKEKK